MGFEVLRQKYGNGATGRSVVNRAISDEIPGGAKILDLLGETRRRRAKGDFFEQFFERVFQTLVDVRHKMGEATLGKDWKNA